jgi:4-hydroxybenzoate polyprenyltransferase
MGIFLNLNKLRNFFQEISLTYQNGHAASIVAQSPLDQLKLLLGLSRTPHGVLDLATPAMSAMLALGHFPSLGVIILGLITAFAGYTAVYALNDLIDYNIDKKRLALSDDKEEIYHVDEIMIRHPLAAGVLPYTRGVAWFIFWSTIALIGAYLLNPICAVLFVISASLEALYCKLLRITHWKVIPSAIVKATGGLAGVYAVDPDPSLSFVAVLFIWLAAWEIGGQNIANDIVDMENDAKVMAKTTSTVKGLKESVFRVVASVSMASLAGVLIFFFAGPKLGAVYPLGAVILGWFLLLKPARDLFHDSSVKNAAELFNRASYMPAAFLGLTVLSITLNRILS